jgi:hypothetical protein
MPQGASHVATGQASRSIDQGEGFPRHAEIHSAGANESEAFGFLQPRIGDVPLASVQPAIICMCMASLYLLRGRDIRISHL